MAGQPGFWSVEDRLKELSRQVDPLEKLSEAVDFEMFRPVLAAALGTTDRSRGGRPSFDPILKFKMLFLQAQHGLSFEKAEHLVRDRLSPPRSSDRGPFRAGSLRSCARWMRFCGLTIADPVPDANTLWDFREALIAAGALDKLFERLDQAIKNAGYLPMAGQIVDASLVAAPRQRNTEEEKAAIKAGRSALEIWPDHPAKAAQKDTDASPSAASWPRSLQESDDPPADGSWTVKSSKGKAKADGTVQSDIVIPEFGYKTHISIDRRHGFIRRQKVTDAAAHDGARLRDGLIDPANTASSVWADTAYRSEANEQFLANRGKVSKIHRKKPNGKPMPKRTARANAKKSAVRARVEHVFAQQKDRMNLFIRSIGLKRAEATVIMANIAYNLGRWRWWQRRTAPA